MWIQYNPNPNGRHVGDCTIRAVSKALGQDWDTTYAGIVLKGFEMGDMPSANTVWGAYLREHGFTRHIVPHELGDIYTVGNFAKDHPTGTYILSIDGHVVCVQDGDWYDSWDSSNEIPVYYWMKTEV